MVKFWALFFLVFYIFNEKWVSASNTEHRREPRRSYIAKIVEEEKAREIVAPTTEPTLDYDSGESEDGGDSEENEKTIVLNKKNQSKTKPSKQTNQEGKYVAARSASGGKNWYVYKDNKQGLQGRTFSSDEEPLKEVGQESGEGPGNGGGSEGGGPDGSGGNTGGGSGSEGGNVGGGGGNVGDGGKGSGGGNVGGGNVGGGKGSGGGNVGGGGPQGKPYNVQRAKPHHKVDPSGYNFFQFSPKSKLGWLWISRTSPDSKMVMTGRLNPISKDDGGEDIDDLDEANTFDWEFRRFDRACLYLEYKQKRLDVKVPTVPEEIKRLVEIQNHKLARSFINWQFEAPESPMDIALGEMKSAHPHYLSFKFIQGVVSLFTSKICKAGSSYAKAAAAFAPFGEAQKALLTGSADGDNSGETVPEFLPTSFTDNLLNYFFILRNSSISTGVPDYATKEDDEIIFEKILTQCHETGDTIPWFYHSCGDQLLSSDEYNNYACTPFDEYDFNPKKYDPILDAIWHMFTAVHSYCFKHFHKNSRLWHRFALIIANTFTPEMRMRWAASVAPEKFYIRLLGPESTGYFENINRCTFAATLRSDAPMMLPRFDNPSRTTF